MKRYARIADGVVVEIIELDDTTTPADAFHPDIVATLQECADEVQNGWVLKGNKLVAPLEAPPTLDATKAARVEALRAVCEATITGGFKSAALGEVHTYPSDIKAQINLMGSVTDSIMPDLPANWTTPFWVCDATGIWAWRMHSAAQIQQAGRDGKAHVVACQAALVELTELVLKAEDLESLNDINWPSS